MPELTLDNEALKGYLPHRGVNLYVDEVWTNHERTVSRSRTRIGRDDTRGRTILTRRDAHGQPCWAEPFLAELMALTGVCLMYEQLAPLGQVSVFSMISKIAYSFLPGIDDEVIGHASITRQRSGFTQYATRAEANGRTILEAEVMSGAAKLSDIASAPVKPFAGGIQGTAIDPALFTWKDARIRFIDRLVSADKATGKIVCSYVYPTDHPFVPGHFPGAPLMMGVTQWGAAADAVWLARCLFGLSGPVVAQCTIKRDTGAEILDVRDLVLTDDGGVPFIAETRRLAFREPVRPGDGILIEATVLPKPR